MKKIISLLAVTLMLGFAAVQTRAAEEKEKEVTLKGTAVCAKCELHETEKCHDALKVSVDGKDVIYLFENSEATKGFHKEICHGPKENVTVTGFVTEKEGKHFIKPTKIE